MGTQPVIFDDAFVGLQWSGSAVTGSLLASEAERLAAGTAWLPAILCRTAVEVESPPGASPDGPPGEMASSLTVDERR